LAPEGPAKQGVLTGHVAVVPSMPSDPSWASLKNQINESPVLIDDNIG
jgi:hypothetical protein